ncbi:MAG: hypothetical protein IID48_13605 [Proteobacteria bacterium]|nr:hypothetical protein [Pseudomonadota bacterium]
MTKRKHPYVSREFYHFVGRNTLEKPDKSYDILLKVLDGGCVSHPPHTGDWGTVKITEDLSKNLLTEELIVPTVTCFCDIPLKSLGIHMKKYGKFAVGFKREYLLQYGVRPVIYVPYNELSWMVAHGGLNVLGEIEAKYKGFAKQVVPKAKKAKLKPNPLGSEPTDYSQAVKWFQSVFQLHILSFIKPFNSNLPEEHSDNYYMEREWRKFGNLRFKPDNVEIVIVDDAYVNRFKKDQPKYAGRVISAASIAGS